MGGGHLQSKEEQPQPNPIRHSVGSCERSVWQFPRVPVRAVVFLFIQKREMQCPNAMMQSPLIEALPAQ